MANEYTQGVCEDGAAILENGVPLTIEQIIEKLQIADCDLSIVYMKGVIDGKATRKGFASVPAGDLKAAIIALTNIDNFMDGEAISECEAVAYELMQAEEAYLIRNPPKQKGEK